MIGEQIWFLGMRVAWYPILFVLCATSQFAKAGERVRIAMDVHVHAFSDSSWGKEVKAADIIQTMDEGSVEKAVVISAGYFEGLWRLFLSTPFFGRSEERVKHENDYIASIVRQYPARLIGACGVHPMDPWASTEVHRCIGDLGMRVVKIHPNAQRLDIDDNQVKARLLEHFKEIGNLGAVALVHAFGRTIEYQKSVVELALQAPDTNFIFAHMFGDMLPDIARVIGEKPHRNIFVDISGSIFEISNPVRQVEAMRSLGMDRILFGSDYPTATPKDTLAALHRLPLTSQEVSSIIGNAGPFVAGAGQSTAAAAETIPMFPLHQTPFFVTKVKIGENITTRMLVDTGASDTVLFHWFALKERVPVSAATGQGRDSGGRTFQLERASVPSLSLGNTVKPVSSLVVVPTIDSFEKESIGGIFSPQSFFKDQEFVLDFPSRKMTGGTDSQRQLKPRKHVEGLALYPCSKKGDKFAVNVTVNGVPGRFYLDSGDQRSVITREFADKLGPLSGRQSERQGVGSKRTVETVSGLIISMGSTTIAGEIDVESKGIACSVADGKLGGDVLGKFALFFSADRKEVHLYQ